MPKVIIMMSTYNGEKYLAEQIESILNQTEKDFILKVHDDGSTDGTLKIIKEYAQKDNRIYIDNSGHKGYPKCFFDLMKDAGEAKFYAFSDQDDVWLPDKIETAIKKIGKGEEPTLYGCKKIIVDENLNEIGKDTEQQSGIIYAFLCKNEIFGCTMVFNKSLHDILIKYIPTRKDLYHDSWIYKIALIFGKTIIDKSAFIMYRQHANNTVGATHKGIRLFFDKLKRFDFTFKRYKNGPYRNSYVKEILIGYGNIMPPNKKKILETIYYAKYKFNCRYMLFNSRDLRNCPIYERMGKKLLILLGWI